MSIKPVGSAGRATPAQPIFDTPAQRQPVESTAAADTGGEGGGAGLGDNLSVQAARADWLYHSRQYQARRRRDRHQRPMQSVSLSSFAEAKYGCDIHTTLRDAVALTDVMSSRLNRKLYPIPGRFACTHDIIALAAEAQHDLGALDAVNYT